jgi:hypothetical protein
MRTRNVSGPCRRWGGATILTLGFRQGEENTMTNDKTDPRRQAGGAVTDRFRIMAPLFLFLAFALAEGCSGGSPPPPTTVMAIPCLANQPLTVNPGAKPGVSTAAAGTIPGTFSVTSAGEASYVLPLTTVPGRAGVEPHLNHRARLSNRPRAAAFSADLTPNPLSLARPLPGWERAAVSAGPERGGSEQRVLLCSPLVYPSGSGGRRVIPSS